MFLQALKKEIELQKNYFEAADENAVIKSVYLGGGTPSLLSERELVEIFERLNYYFTIDPVAEITLEANPDDLVKGKIAGLKNTPVNRLSIGIQSFSDEDLRFMNRSHNAYEAECSVKLAQDAGFSNITIDLIYGTPTMTNRQWKKNLELAFALAVPHISAYSLTVEPRTVLANWVKKKKICDINDERSAEQFILMLELMSENGFIQYEISNFGKENFFSFHNSSYWKGKHYLGLGPSAHSFNGTSRQWNVRSNMKYIKSLLEGNLDFEKEILSEMQQYNEYILTSLRTMWGIDQNHILDRFGKNFYGHLLAEAGQWLITGHLKAGEGSEKNKLFLSEKGKLLADKISRDLFKI